MRRGVDGAAMNDASVWRMSRSWREVSLKPGVSIRVIVTVSDDAGEGLGADEGWVSSTLKLKL